LHLKTEFISQEDYLEFDRVDLHEGNLFLLLFVDLILNLGQKPSSSNDHEPKLIELSSNITTFKGPKKSLNRGLTVDKH
jgi:hypothetical protein